MRKIISILAYIPGIAVGVSSLMLLTYTPYSPVLVILAIFDALGCLYLLDNTDNIAKGLVELWYIITEKSLRHEP